ncbi:TPA: restriction endonuclease subunit S, partial [Staphylococcus aureus]|nr:restriction endonuclease subunit S [Staphylococcus aureus]
MSREMKYSGIEWIGYIPKYWTITKLKNIIDFISGYAFKSELFTISDNNKKVITIKSFNTKEIILDNLSYSNESLKFPTKYLLKNNDILFAMSGGTTGKNLLIEQVDDLYYINQRVGIIRSSFSK